RSSIWSTLSSSTWLMTDCSRCRSGTKPEARARPKQKSRGASPGFFLVCTGQSADDFGVCKPVPDFLRSGFRSVGAVHGILTDGQRVRLADRALSRVSRVRRTHDFAVLGDCVFAFQNLHDGWARRHGVDQFTKEWTFLVDGVEAFRFTTAHPDALRGDDAKAGILQHLGDGAGQVALGGVRLDHGKGAFDCHFWSFTTQENARCASITSQEPRVKCASALNDVAYGTRFLFAQYSAPDINFRHAPWRVEDEGPGHAWTSTTLR